MNYGGRAFTDEIKEFVFQRFYRSNAYGIEEWKTLTLIELGILNWYLGNLYCSPLRLIEEPT